MTHAAVQPDPEQPLVSVVVTSCNGESYIAAQLDSILQQTYANLEIIICDDNSADNTRAIILAHAARDTRIALILQPANIGLHRNLETGLLAARGTYIAIADQDDIWHTDKITKLLAGIGNRIAAFSDSELIDQDGKRLEKTLLETLRIRDPQTATSPLRLLKKNCVSGHALLFHQRLLAARLPFDERMLFDRHLAIAAAVQGGLYFHPEPLVQHRIHHGNHTNSRFARRDETASLPSSNQNSQQASLVAIRDRQYESYRFRFQLILDLLRQQTALQPQTVPTHVIDIPQPDFFLKTVSNIVTLMEQEEKSWFRIRLLLALWRFEHTYRLFGFRRVLRLCKGKPWYATVQYMASRIRKKNA